jgi:DNA-binding NarL/FixJ family response regulator
MDIRIIIFEDNPSFRISLYHLLNGSEGFYCAGTFENCQNLLKHIRETKPDVILMDIAMPGMDGIEAVRIIRAHCPDQKILMQTIFQDNEKIFDAIVAGAHGYILKSTSPVRILDAIRETHEGGTVISPSIASKVLKMISNPPPAPTKKLFDLTEREIEILRLLVKGLSYKMIGAACLISIDTVRSHIKNIYQKLHVNSKGEAIATAIKGNIV